MEKKNFGSLFIFLKGFLRDPFMWQIEIAFLFITFDKDKLHADIIFKMIDT